MTNNQESPSNVVEMVLGVCEEIHLEEINILMPQTVAAYDSAGGWYLYTLLGGREKKMSDSNNYR